MKLYYTIALALLIVSCKEEKTDTYEQENNVAMRQVVVSEFQTIIDTANVEGSILLYDLEADTYYSNDFNWTQKGKLPASTFKITNSIIALETDIVASDSTLFKWNGEPRRLKVWEQDLNFRDAFQFSCVPCYQDVARKIGAKRMNSYLEKLNYGTMKVDSSNIDIFWLEGESKITQMQQIDFLKRLYLSELAISKRTETLIKRIMVIEKNEQYVLSGKTGWSIRNKNNNGWFVGYIEAKNKVYFFASNIEPKAKFDMSMFPVIRKDITNKAFEHMDILD